MAERRAEAFRPPGTSAQRIALELRFRVAAQLKAITMLGHVSNRDSAALHAVYRCGDDECRCGSAAPVFSRLALETRLRAGSALLNRQSRHVDRQNTIRPSSSVLTVPQHAKRPPRPARRSPIAVELAGAGGRTAHICGQADLGGINIVAGEGRASTTIDHRVALVAGVGSAVNGPERSALRAIGSSPPATWRRSWRRSRGRLWRSSTPDPRRLGSSTRASLLRSLACRSTTCTPTRRSSAQ